MIEEENFYTQLGLAFTMRCQLCDLEIADYNHTLNEFKVDDAHSVFICQSCADKFMKWQQGIYARLFPTKTAKKVFRENK
jgi:hypothetical protein